MTLKKTIILTDTIENANGDEIAEMQTYLTGDGSTPVVRTMGLSEPIGYSDDGRAILPEQDDKVIEKRQQEFMAAAIAEQKDFCKQNGVDLGGRRIIKKKNKEDK